MKQFCGKCVSYQGTEKVPNAKSTAWFDSSRPKCALGKSAEKQDYKCESYEEKK